MKRMLLSLGIFGVVVGLVGCRTTGKSRAVYWQERAARVAVGDTRETVEALLPPWAESTFMSMSKGGSQWVQYWVDADWQVQVTYDYTGARGDEDGHSLSQVSPLNKVLVAPTLKYQKMPPGLTIE